MATGSAATGSGATGSRATGSAALTTGFGTAFGCRAGLGPRPKSMDSASARFAGALALRIVPASAGAPGGAALGFGGAGCEAFPALGTAKKAFFGTFAARGAAESRGVSGRAPTDHMALRAAISAAKLARASTFLAASLLCISASLVCISALLAASFFAASAFSSTSTFFGGNNSAEVSTAPAGRGASGGDAPFGAAGAFFGTSLRGASTGTSARSFGAYALR
mmetsp:Transcript_8107/g.26582  ORF Transcript_8107/g.26582 Transcript_8107/m.26582 type:complete len:223 (+) Transcript_8107:2329-2997(+)